MSIHKCVCAACAAALNAQLAAAPIELADCYIVTDEVPALHEARVSLIGPQPHLQAGQNRQQVHGGMDAQRVASCVGHTKHESSGCKKHETSGSTAVLQQVESSGVSQDIMDWFLELSGHGDSASSTSPSPQPEDQMP